MPTLPSASVTVTANATALTTAAGYLAILAPVATAADTTPRLYQNWKAIYTKHGYSPGLSLAASFIEKTGQPVIFVGIPVATAATVGRQNSVGVTGSSVISVAAGGGGYLEEVDAVLTVTTGGTIGTNGIVFTLSLDGGRTENTVRLGTATSYTVPYVGIVISFAAGTLVAGDVYTFATTHPMWDSTGITNARIALAQQLKRTRSWLVIGDCATDTIANGVVTAANAYRTTDNRFTGARVNTRDRLPYAEMSRTSVRMSGSPTVTFAEVGATGDTITRSTGSFVTDGFAAGMAIDVSGSGSNNFTKAKITAVSALVLTLDTQDLVAEGPVSSVTIVGSHGVTFAEVGATGDTITRSGGSWVADGFRAGDLITVASTSSNNFASALVTAVTATVLTLDTQDLTAEFIGTKDVTLVGGELMSDWVATMDAEFAPIDGEERISIGLGRGRLLCPVTGYYFRRPAAWLATIRQYQKDIHQTTWAKEDGPLSGVSLEDEEGNIVEFDERTDGGGLAGRFTCLRTWGNGPNGAFVAMDLTRETEGSVLQLTHNMAVANECCTIVQAETENFVGKVVLKDADGHAKPEELTRLEERVNTALQRGLLQEKVPGAGPRASKAVWRANTNDDLSGPDARVTGVAELIVNGTIVHVDTDVKVS